MIFRSVDSKLSDLRGALRLRAESIDFMCEVSQIERVAAKLRAELGGADVQLMDPTELKQRWFQMLQGRCKMKLSRREVRMLSLCQEVALTQDFLRFISENFSPVPAAVVRGLLAAHAQAWQSWPQGRESSQKIKVWVEQHRRNPRLSWWAEYPEFWFSADASRNIAVQMRAAMMTSEVAAKEFRAPVASGLIKASLTVGALDMCDGIVKLSANERDYLLNGLLHDSLLDLDVLHTCVFRLIETKLADTDPNFRANLINSFLLNARLGDPRIRPANWQSLQLATARAALLSWLSIEDIRTFFEIILPRRDDPHGRKNFWLRFESRILMSRVFISQGDRQHRREQLEDLQNRGRSYGSIKSSSAFILDFGGVVAVEFSKVGNALYLYTKKSFQAILADMFVEQTHMHILKRIDLAIESVRHIDGWQRRAAKVLEQHGIRAEK